MKKALNVVVMWHMHQPCYLDPETGRALMPWVRVHAMKDYYDMARYVEEIPGTKAVVNVVPSLWEQLEHQAEGEWLDEHEFIARLPEESLTGEQRRFIAEQFFAAHYPAMIEPYPEYRALCQRFGPKGDPARIQKADTQTLRDILVWFHLAWCGRTLREEPLIAGLFAKAKGFTSDEKLALLDRIRAFLAEIPAYYRKLAQAGVIEITTTPFFHPILPLLLNPDSAHEACPGMPLPKGRYALPGDAAAHVERGVACHARLFGEKPAGCWPAEGSVSSAAARLFAQNGVRWIATDEEVLRLSLGKERLDGTEKFRFWAHEGTHFLFRDHSLSDLIGFVYQNGDPVESAQDFVNHLLRIQNSLPDDGTAYVVPVILDGENCWEFYREQGKPFLHSLYGLLSQSPRLAMRLGREALAETASPKPLPRLHTGSWIDANFTTWVGDPVKNRAWSLLYAARRAAQAALDDPAFEPARKQALFEHIMAAEGSDWFWWFGEGHSSDHDAMFDLLFRKRLKAIWRTLGADVPEELNKPVDERWLSRLGYTQPAYRIHPRIDGRKGSYWEWLAAGSCYPMGGTMQRAAGHLAALRFGFDERELFLRIEFVPEAERRGTLELVFAAPRAERLRLPLEEVALIVDQGATQGPRFAVRQVAEIALRFDWLDPAWKPGEALSFFVNYLEDGVQRERLPGHDTITLAFPGESFDEENWLV